MLALHRPEDKEQIDPQRGQLQEDAPAGEARVNPAERATPTAPSAFPRDRSLPHERGVDLRGEGVVLKGRDLAEDVGQEQVDCGDGDGGQVLQEEADQPVVSALKQMAHTHSVSLSWPPSKVSHARPPDVQVSHLILRRQGGEVDEEEGTGQQTQDGHVEHEPEQVETHLLPQRPLSRALGEALLLQKELRHQQRGFVRIRNPSKYYYNQK